ncbi:NADH dehydrogenase (ubiquinone)-like protein [Apiospora marii]|uniref:NADH dehydrogenase (ubiquinone)-like protein n=1 Tax=Apiospora marii TaxID=335849 RepID=UPI003131C4F8
MRYEDWDLLIFPQDSKVPLQEFKTQCHVVHDPEFAFTSGAYGLPTLTCFVPGLTGGTPFNISLHNWRKPEISQYTRSYSQHLELVKWEARVVIDGRLVASSSFDQGATWPQLLSRSFEFTKNGELEPLKFPHFREELLQQNYWSPSDELGRIKIIISEGFPRDSLTVPVERVKNIITFSFQHAPADILESSGIAWPNPSMWYRSPAQAQSMPVPTQLHKDGSEAHIHSPRRSNDHGVRKSMSSSHEPGMAGWTATQTRSFLGNMPHTQSLLQRGLKGGINSSINSMDAFYQPYSDPSPHLSDWTFPSLGPLGQSPSTQQSKLSSRQAAGQKAFRRKLTSSDASMPDYISDADSTSRYMAGLQQTGSHAHNSSSTMVNGDAENGLQHPKAPSNTPNSLSARGFVNDAPSNDLFVNSAKASRFPPELATSLTQSLLNQPCPLPNQAGTPMTAPGAEVKSRKETRLGVSRPDSSAPSLLDHLDMRKVSQAVFGNPSDSFGQSQVYENGENSSREASSGTSPQPSSRTFSGVFSQRSGSGSDLAKKQNNTSSFTHADVEVSTPTSMGKIGDVGLLGSGKGIKRTRHLTPTGFNVD